MTSLTKPDPTYTPRPGQPRRLSAPRERTLTELGLRDTRFEPLEPVSHHLMAEWECQRLRCYAHDRRQEMDCGE